MVPNFQIMYEFFSPQKVSLLFLLLDRWFALKFQIRGVLYKTLNGEASFRQNAILTTLKKLFL